MPKNGKEIKRTITDSGFRFVGWLPGNRGHQKAEVEIWGETRTLIFSGSPTNLRGMLNGIKNDLRRIKRELKGIVAE